MGARGPAPTPVLDRVMSKVLVDSDTGCWLFQGRLSSTGYGYIFNTKTPGSARMITSHRVVWVARNGPVPDGLELDHLCRVRSCCNPNHLEPVSHAENVRRGLHGSGVQYGGVPRQANCRRGHPLTTDNTYVRSNGARACRMCINTNKRNRKVSV